MQSLRARRKGGEDGRGEAKGKQDERRRRENLKEEIAEASDVRQTRTEGRTGVLLAKPAQR